MCVLGLVHAWRTREFRRSDSPARSPMFSYARWERIMKETESPPAGQRKPGRSSMSVHRFSLIYTGKCQLDDEIENAIFEAGCDDALLGVQAGGLFLDFARE